MKYLTFGSFIKSARLDLSIGQRELSRMLGISSAYLNDIEQDKRSAPSDSVLESIRYFLKIDNDLFFDLAGKSKKRLPPDLEAYLLENKAAVTITRMLKNLNYSEGKMMELKNLIASQNYKAIIIAAGLGSRLGELTRDTPKCMLKINSKTILEHQLDAYKANGISDISIVRGFKKEKIQFDHIKYYENTDYKNNNILNSLFYAEKELNGNVIISYSDIVFSPKIIERLLESSADISIVVDIDWRGRYENRMDHPVEEAENVFFDANQAVVDIGKITSNIDDVHGEFIGMMKFSPRGVEIFKRHFHRAKELYWNKPFQRSNVFQNAYLTDILKDMTELGVHISTVIVEQGWVEIDTKEDLETASNFIKKWDQRYVNK